MAKGSQLTQLKAALSNAGIIGQKPSKKRKRGTPVEKDKEKHTSKLEEIHRRLNPFDVKVTKLKHEVGGRKLKGVTGKPAQSKQAGLEQRKKTLLKEYEEKDRAGGIIDRRFGENDASMSVEERMLERFTRERQRASKGTAFNLEEEEDLTHYGQSLSKLDDFDDIGLRSASDDEETSGQIGHDVVSRAHFGGFEDEEDEGGPPRKKSKAEVMAEVVAKSKEHKLRRQMEKDAADNVRHELDGQFAALRELIYAPDPIDGTTKPPPAGDDDPEKSTVVSDSVTAKLLPRSDNYDHHVRELGFDKRAKPKDRTKTDEELALEAKEALEEAEKKRRRRMLGLPESDSEAETRKGRKRKRGADDLDDEVEQELGEYERLGAGLEGGSVSDAEGEDGDNVQFSDEESGDNSQAEDAESLYNEDEDEDDEGEGEGEVVESLYNEDEDEDDEGEGEGEVVELVPSLRAAREKSKGKVKEELPFTFPCPESHEEFLDVVEGVEDLDVCTVVQRIRTLYHQSLAPDNKFKLQKLATVLIDHVLHVASPRIVRFSLISSLFPHILALTRTYPIPIAQHFNEKLTLMHKNLKRGLSQGALKLESKTWPGIPELSLLRMIGLIWSTSDLHHAVVSPTRLIIGAYLGLCRVRSLRDIASGLFLSTLTLQFEVLSKRFVPEATNFLTNVVLHLAPHRYEEVDDLPGSFPAPDFRSELCRGFTLDGKARKKLVMRKPDLNGLMNAMVDDEQAKADLLSLTFELLGKYADLYKGIEGFTELVEPILTILEHVEVRKLCEGHKTQLSRVTDSIQRLLKFSHQSRQPLRLQAHKPIPIPTYIPKFETTTSSYLRQRDPDHEKNQAAKLRAQYKQERKGAIRELRKDAKFLAEVEQKKQVEKDKVYHEKMRRVFGSIEGERAEEKRMEKRKAKEKRRAGRK